MGVTEQCNEPNTITTSTDKLLNWGLRLKSGGS